jgi:ACS family glucarate transporter-like MFS transporter
MLTASKSRTLLHVQACVVALLVAFSVMSYFDRTIMSIAGPVIMKEFSLSETSMGAVFSAFLLSYALMNLPGGHLADRFGPRLVLTVMGLGAALFTGLTALGGKPGLGVYLGIVPSFVLIRLAMGFFTGPLYPSCARTSANWVSEGQRARVWGLIAAGAGLGGATSPLLFSWMIGRYGWRMSFGLAAVVTGALAIVWFRYVRDRPSEHPSLANENSVSIDATASSHKAEKTPWKLLLTNRNLMLLAAGYFAVNYFDYIYFFWIYYYLGEIRHLGQTESAVAATLVFLTWMVMSPLGGWVSDRLVLRWGPKIGRRAVAMVGLTLAAALLCIGINLTGAVATVAALCLSFGFASSTDGPYWATATSLGGRHVGAACGILNTGGNLGGVAPYIAPLIAAHAGWTWGLYTASIILMAAVLIWLFIDPAGGVNEPA